MLDQIVPGQLHGRLEVIERITDGRYRLKCRGCRYEGVILSRDALNRGRITQCWDCVQKQKESARKRVTSRVTSVPVPIRVRKDEDGWTLREAA